MTNYIIRDVNKLIMKYKTKNPFEIADDMNTTVKYDDLGTLKGFIFISLDLDIL